MKNGIYFTLSLVTWITLFKLGDCIQCYQCDSNEDKSCPSNRPFDTNLNALIDCNSFEAKVPGTFCMKVTQESPGWGSWKKVSRRCGSRSDTGVAWGCRWTYEENGVWKETCYCEDRDGCNSGNSLRVTLLLLLPALVSLLHTFL